jgi:parvulin-like peptidyl-prolyl isomerase
MAMGLDKDDVIIRRRLSQKLEFLFQDLADAVPPEDQELQAFFEANRDRYQDPELITFTHVFLDPDRRGDQTLVDAETMLAEFRAQDDPTRDAADRGDLFMLQSYYPQRPEVEISKLFGWEFAKSVFELDPEQWHGPVLSGYGVHLVYVHDRTQAPPPSYDAVVERVTDDWQTDRRQAFNEEFVENLMSRYEITIEDDESNEAVAKR